VWEACVCACACVERERERVTGKTSLRWPTLVFNNYFGKYQPKLIHYINHTLHHCDHHLTETTSRGIDLARGAIGSIQSHSALCAQAEHHGDRTMWQMKTLHSRQEAELGLQERAGQDLTPRMTPSDLLPVGRPHLLPLPSSQ
jgi:hypothetical protein